MKDFKIIIGIICLALAAIIGSIQIICLLIKLFGDTLGISVIVILLLIIGIILTKEKL